MAPADCAPTAESDYQSNLFLRRDAQRLGVGELTGHAASTSIRFFYHSRSFPQTDGAPYADNERTAGNVTVVDLSGAITLNKGDDQVLKDKIGSLVHQGHRNILVNMAGVPTVDSAGLGELVGAYTTVKKAGGSMKLLNLTTRLHNLLTITKLVTVFETFDSESDALQSFN